MVSLGELSRKLLISPTEKDECGGWQLEDISDIEVGVANCQWSPN